MTAESFDHLSGAAVSATDSANPRRRISVHHELLAARGVWLRQQLWRVDRYRLQHGIGLLQLVSLDRRQSFLTPFDRPRARPRRDRPRDVRLNRALGRACDVLAQRASLRLPLTLLRASVDLLPFQIEPVLAVLAGIRRVLIADEVGLGKTVQAGLIAAELVRREWPVRILILVPPSLQHQWTEELEQRLGLPARILDASTVATLSREGPVGTNPWDEPGVWLASVDYLKQPHVHAALPRRPWDLLIVDEAHEVCGDSARHHACDAVGRRARHIVLLTGTPHSGDQVRFDRLRNIGRLAGAPADDIATFRRSRREAGVAANCHVHWHALIVNHHHATLLDALLHFERVVSRRAADGRPLLLLSVFRKRALSTLRAFRWSVQRRLDILQQHEHPVDPWMQAHLPFTDDAMTEDEQAALYGDTRLEPRHERSWLQRLLRLATIAPDSKLSRLRTWLRRTHEPVIVFTEFRHSLEEVARVLQHGRVSSVMHGGQSSREQADALRDFRRRHSSVLIATDVAGQGLNLQDAARWVISVELPWNPLKLEQRLGRVDRIGQQRRTHMTLLTVAHKAESMVIARLARRVFSARRAVGSGTFAVAPPPPLLEVAAAVIDRKSLGEPAPPVPVVTTSPWTRAARAATRVIARRRRLAQGWRGPAVVARPWRAAPRHAVPRRLAVVSVPILDGNGAELERIVLRLQVPHGDRTAPASMPDPLVLQAIAHHATRARVARVARLCRTRAVRRVAIEQALAEARGVHRDDHVALDLFASASRVTRTSDAAQLRRRVHEDEVTRRLSTLRASTAAITCGTPTIEVILPEWWA